MTGAELLEAVRWAVTNGAYPDDEVIAALNDGCVLLTREEAEGVAMFYQEALALIRELADDLKGFYEPEKGWPPHIEAAKDLGDHEEYIALLEPKPWNVIRQAKAKQTLRGNLDRLEQP